jgi:hypothetical protein
MRWTFSSVVNGIRVRQYHLEKGSQAGPALALPARSVPPPTIAFPQQEDEMGKRRALADQRLQDGLLAGEVVVEEDGGDPCQPGNVLDRTRAKPSRRKLPGPYRGWPRFSVRDHPVLP